VLFISPQREHLKYVLQIHYKASNKGEEYKALIHGLRIAVSLGIKRILAYVDSKTQWMVPHNNNVATDVLSKLCSRRALVPAGVFIQDLRKPSIKLLDPNNPDHPHPDLTTTPPQDTLMTEKRMIGVSLS
jgi:hypothetical protein